MNSYNSIFLITNNEIANYYKDLIHKDRLLNIGDVYIHTKKRFKLIRYLLNNRYYSFRKPLIKSKTKEITTFCTLNRIKLIHTHLDYALYSAIHVKNIQIGIKLIHTFHGAFGLVENTQLKPDIPLKEFNYTKIDVSVFVAKYLYELFITNGIDIGEHVIIYNGMQLPERIKTIKENSANKLKKILYVGGSKYVKGYDTLVNTVELLAKNNIIDLKITALGPLNQDCGLIQMAKKKGLDKYFDFVGFVTPPDHFRFFQENDILFMPSRSEALPMAAIESIFFNLPIIATNTGGLAEIIEDGKNGYLCDPSAADFAQKIVSFYKDPVKFKYEAEFHNESLRSKFEIKSIVQQLNALYKHQLN